MTSPTPLALSRLALSRLALARLALSSLALVFVAADLVGQRSRRGGPPPKLEHLAYQRHSFESEALGGRDAEYGVFLPKELAEQIEAGEVDAATAYPLVVFLHGMWEDRDRFLTRGGGAVLDKMTGEGEFPKTIFVCADGDRSSFWIDAIAKDSKYESLVIADLIDEVAGRFPIAKERARRVLMGVSMGGYGALKIALKHPERFGIVAAHSAAILPEDPEVLEERYDWLRGRGKQLVTVLFGDPLDADRWKAENVLSLAKAAEAKRLDGLKIYFDCGDADRYGFHTTNAELHDLLAEQEIPHTWQLVEGGNHGWASGYNQGQLPASLRFVAAQLAVRRGVSGLGGLLGGDRDK